MLSPKEIRFAVGFDFVRQLEILCVSLSCAETTFKRMATPITAMTARAPPIAAPIITPTPCCACGGCAVIPAAIPATGFAEGESVGPGVSVGVTEGEAPMRRLGVGVGVELGVTDGVTDRVGEGV